MKKIIEKNFIAYFMAFTTVTLSVVFVLFLFNIPEYTSNCGPAGYCPDRRAFYTSLFLLWNLFFVILYFLACLILFFAKKIKVKSLIISAALFVISVISVIGLLTFASNYSREIEPDCAICVTAPDSEACMNFIESADESGCFGAN